MGALKGNPADVTGPGGGCRHVKMSCEHGRVDRSRMGATTPQARVRRSVIDPVDSGRAATRRASAQARPNRTLEQAAPSRVAHLCSIPSLWSEISEVEVLSLFCSTLM